MIFARRPHWLKRFTTPKRSEPLLTFDDGPHPVHTPAVLDRLREFHRTAAFFLLGQRIEDAPQLIEEIREAGHLIGNHTHSHRRLSWFDFARAQEEVSRCQALIPAAKLFRPPFGKLTPGLWLAARRHGLTCMNWTLDSGDWQCRSAADAKECARQTLERIRPGDIVLFHDNHRWIEPILDLVLPAISNNAAEMIR